MHSQTKQVVDYPNTKGKKLSLEYHNWRSLDKIQEVIKVPSVLRLAQLIDDQNWLRVGGLNVGHLLDQYLIEFDFDGFCNERLDCQCKSPCGCVQLDCQPGVMYTDNKIVPKA